MKRLLLPAGALVIGWFLTSETIHASPCSYPKRMVGGYTVDLQPLIDWWSSPKGVRPLSSWKHVRGSIVHETPSGWVIEGKIGDHGRVSTFFLKNPPRQKLLRFQELHRQLPNYERAQAETRELASRPVCTDWYSYWLTQWQAPPVTVAEHRQATARLGELNRNINAIHDELASMEDEHGNFRLDAFALKVNETYQGMPVFDHGATEPFHYAARR
jgi:hypothetical protein